MTMTTLELAPVLRPAEVAELAREQTNVRLLDVRTPGEYETVHISGAYNVPLDTLGEHAREIRANVADPIVLVCQSGQRARKAEEALKAAGLDNLHVLDGGVNGWVAAGLPVVRGGKKLSLERQVRIVAGALAAVGGVLGAFVNPLFGLLAAFVGSGLVFAGLTDTCGMAMVLAKLSYNRPATCDVSAMVRALSDGRAPAGIGRAPVTFATAPRTCAN
jgi:rhodanese-related sulfurtransferase